MCARGSWKRGPPSGRFLSLGRFHVGPVRRTHRQWGEIGREGEEVAAAPIPWTTIVWTAKKVRLASAVVRRLSVSQPLGAGLSGLHQFVVGISCATTPAGRTRTTHLDTHMAGMSSTVVYLVCSAIDYEYHGLESWASSRNCISTVGLWRVWKGWHLHIQSGGIEDEIVRR